MKEEAQTIEEMFFLLKAEGVDPERLPEGTRGDSFQRVIRFAASGVVCWIEWWKNFAYLSIGSRYGSTVGFHRVEVDTSWPSMIRGLRFVDDCAPEARVYLATKRLDWQEEPTP